MMNKKAETQSKPYFLQFVINAAIVTVVIYFLFIFVFGVGGGFVAVFKAGGALNKLFTVLPWWGTVAVILFVFWLFFGGRK